jgi:aminoglycoside 2''-phosphotransferase
MSQYLERIRQAFPALPLDKVAINTDGLVNDVVIVNGMRVFRFAKTDEGKATLARESRALDLIRRYVELPIPAYLHLDVDFAAYNLIPGEPLFRNDFLQQDAAVQSRIIAQLGTFYASFTASHAQKQSKCSASTRAGHQARSGCAFTKALSANCSR